MVDPSARTPARLRWVDGARGIGIVLVVYGHAQRALFTNGLPGWAMLVDRLIYAFHMPLFFLLSGLFVWPSLARSRKRYVADKLTTIVYPYFLWSLVEGGLELVFANRVNTPVDAHDLAMIPIVPIEQFWFLYVLALCSGLALLCYPHRWAVGAVAGIGLAMTARYGISSMPLRTFAFFPFVGIGIIGGAPILAIGDSASRAGLVLVAATAMFSALFMHGGYGLVEGLILGLTGSIAIAAASALLDRGVAGTALALLGRGSLAIYVMHTIFSAGTRIGARAADLIVSPPALLAISTVVGICGPLCVWLIAERLKMSLVLGLGRPVRRALQFRLAHSAEAFEFFGTPV